jgi:hypothetical protein
MSIVFQNENTTLQFGDTFGNIGHRGILASNIVGTTPLTETFPTTSTGDSLGHYHYTESGTNALKFLNSSGTGSGGHQFWNSNDTDAPIKYFEVNRSNALLNTSLRNDTSLTVLNMNTNELTLRSNGNSQYLNASQSTLSVRNNANSDNVRVQCDNIAVGNDINSTSMAIYSTLTRMSDPQYWNTCSTSNIVINKLGTSEQSELTTKKLTLHDANTNVTMLSPTSLLIDDGNNNTSFNDTSGLTIRTATDVSILSATDLTFNGTSLKTQVSTNTTDIGTNTTNIATNTTNIATNTTNITNNSKSISKLQYASPINIAISPIIYGTLPSSPPMVPTIGATNSGYNGWYYKNISTTYNNISWSVGFQPSSYVVSNLKGMYFNFVSLTTTSKPFISVYTLPAQAPGGFYNSRRSYVPASSPAVITAGIPYTYYFMYDNNYPTPFKYCHSAVPLTLSNVNPVGAFGDSELLYFMSINTNSISTIGTEELIISECGVIIDDGTGTIIQPFSFNSADVYSPNSYKTVIQSVGTITPTSVNNGTTYIGVANFTIANTGLNGIPAGFFIRVHANGGDRTITYNTSSTVIVHTSTGSTNAGEVIFYWTGTSFTVYT